MLREVEVGVISRGAMVLIAAALAVAVTVGCGGGAGSGAGNRNDSNNDGVDIALRSSASLGNYLVSGDGRTLYYFGLDLPADATHAAVSNCTGTDCLPLWPIFHVASPVLGAGLNAADFGELVRSDGVKQTTYKGWPLYFYAGDSRAGDTNGDNLDVWYVIKVPFYSALAMTKTGGPALYLADPAGRTLYVDARDTAGSAPTCVAACLNNWLVFAAGNGPLPTGIDAAKLTTVTRPDGLTQSAFDGHLLYYFARDAAPGDLLGRGGLQGAFDVLDPTAL
jgi:predicted lipoprotein with Yx(FWY)xxD motif